MKKSKRIAYAPLEDILATPVVRLLRAMHHFDWVTGFDLFEAAGAPEYEQERHTYTKALSRLAIDGLVERRQSRGLALNKGRRINTITEYRITASGRADLRRRLIIDMGVEHGGRARDPSRRAA